MLEEWQQQEGQHCWCKQTCDDCCLQVNWLQARASLANPHIHMQHQARTAHTISSAGWLVGVVAWLAGWLASWLAGALHITCWQGEAAGFTPPCRCNSPILANVRMPIGYTPLNGMQ